MDDNENEEGCMGRYQNDGGENEYEDYERDSRFGGPQGDEEEDEAARKAAEREAKKAEVRARLQEAGKAKKAKKGFLTPERKKKLKKLLMQKAAEDLKQQQLQKELERQRILQERIIKLPDIDAIDDRAKLEAILKQFHQRIVEVEGFKFDLDYETKDKDHEINELTISVNDLKGKFVKPTLKKVSKYDNKFKKLQALKEEDKIDFRSNLKQSKKSLAEAAAALAAVKKEDEPPPS